MAEEIRKIPFDDSSNIIEAIRAQESFEVVGCGSGNLSEAVKLVEKIVESNGYACRIYTKNRAAALAGMLVPTGATQVAGVLSAAGMAVHNLATYDPDFEIMKRPVDNALVVNYVKTPSKIGELASKVTNSISEVWDQHIPSKEDIVNTASKAADKISSTTSAAADSIADAWDKHAPSKEAVVGSIVVGGLGALVLDKEDVEKIGNKTIASVSEKASSISNATAKAVNVVKENPGSTAAGVAVGVGAIAAAPFTGGGSVVGGATLIASLSGAGTVAAAVGAGTVGAGIGAAISNEQTKKLKINAYNDGIVRGKAESLIIIEKLKNEMRRAFEAYSTQVLRDDFIASLAAIGFSIAACDGPVTDEEKACVEEFILGASKSYLPHGVRDFIEKVAQEPPDFDGAMIYALNFGTELWPHIDCLLEIISESDGEINGFEQDYFTKWENYKIAAKKGMLP